MRLRFIPGSTRREIWRPQSGLPGDRANHRILFADVWKRPVSGTILRIAVTAVKNAFFKKYEGKPESLGTDVIWKEQMRMIFMCIVGHTGSWRAGNLESSGAGWPHQGRGTPPGRRIRPVCCKPAGRALSGLPVFPYGARLSYETMEKINQAEEYIRGLGFYNVRIRLHGDSPGLRWIPGIWIGFLRKGRS